MRIRQLAASSVATTIMYAGASLGMATASPVEAQPSAPTQQVQAAGCSLTAGRPYVSGGALYWAASAGCTTNLRALLNWSQFGPDTTMNEVSTRGTFVRGSRLCNWGPPSNRNFYTTAISDYGEVFSSIRGVYSGGSRSCTYVD